MLSDDGSILGSFGITEVDPKDQGTGLTVSGAVVPGTVASEPSSLALAGVGLASVALARQARRRFA